MPAMKPMIGRGLGHRRHRHRGGGREQADRQGHAGPPFDAGEPAIAKRHQMPPHSSAPSHD